MFTIGRGLKELGMLFGGDAFVILSRRVIPPYVLVRRSTSLNQLEHRLWWMFCSPWTGFFHVVAASVTVSLLVTIFPLSF